MTETTDKIEHIQYLERELEKAEARERAIRAFCESEMHWNYFRAELDLPPGKNVSLENARKIRAFLESHAATP